MELGTNAFTQVQEYKNHFNPDAYLNTYYNFASNRWNWYVKFTMQNYLEVFSTGKVKGKTLLDIGTGPSIYQLLSACEHFEEIITSDYVEENREKFLKWLNKEPTAFNWSSIVQYMCELEGDRDKWHKKEEKLRGVIKTYLKCDVLKSNPVEPTVLPQVDCLNSCLCLEAACKDNDSFISSLKSIVNMIKPGGYLILCGVLRSIPYAVGKEYFFSLYLEKDFVRDSIHKVGCVIEKFEIQTAPKDSGHDLDAFFILAKKNMPAA